MMTFICNGRCNCDTTFQITSEHYRSDFGSPFQKISDILVNMILYICVLSTKWTKMCEVVRDVLSGHTHLFH